MEMEIYRFMFIFVTFIVDNTLSYENNEAYQIKLDSTHHATDQKVGLRPVSSVKDRTFNKSVTKSAYKKWQVGRVSRKQYEIINMLWRKTKEFRDMDQSTVTHYTSNSLLKKQSRMKLPSTTSSFIEFYYLDEGNNPKYQLFKDERSQHESADKIKRGTADYHNFAFRINSPKYIRKFSPTKLAHTIDVPTDKTQILSPSLNGFPHYVPFNILGDVITCKTTLANKIGNTVFDYFNSNTVSNIKGFVDNETCPTTDNTATHDFRKNQVSNTMIPQSPSPNLTTIYDRIKFFEIYDRNTPLPYYDGESKPIDLYDVEKSIHGNKLNNDLKITDKINNYNLNDNNATHRAKLSKKHIIESNIRNILTTETSNKNITNLTLKQHHLTSNLTPFAVNTLSTVATWSEYSFMAAYVYEPSQIYCDAASISPHWLVTSGSCLIRRHNNPRSEGRSAFVAYCGSSWWSPDRVTYVKYSVVHPRYHQKEQQRKYSYNIGLVQVVTSMATCPGWAPVAMMSHQFADYSEGYKAYAVGWGLDRYDARYTSSELPKYPLMAYESKVFSNTCPGNFRHIKKYLEDENGMKNLHCLLLPPYSGEETDPIHGAMLLIEGKLCAIYLQEERRPAGEQSAQYTGIWRLGPWVTEMAHESEDTETFSLT